MSSCKHKITLYTPGHLEIIWDLFAKKQLTSLAFATHSILIFIIFLGKSLVHPLQVGYVESLIQQRLAANETLDSLYASLHSFCQSLQLEVLHNQTIKLCMQRLGKDVRIEEYRPGKCLTISYW